MFGNTYRDIMKMPYFFISRASKLKEIQFLIKDITNRLLSCIHKLSIQQNQFVLKPNQEDSPLFSSAIREHFSVIQRFFNNCTSKRLLYVIPASRCIPSEQKEMILIDNLSTFISLKMETCILPSLSALYISKNEDLHITFIMYHSVHH